MTKTQKTIRADQPRNIQLDLVATDDEWKYTATQWSDSDIRGPAWCQVGRECQTHSTRLHTKLNWILLNALTTLSAMGFIISVRTII